jgi:hypothetical protein
MALSIKSLFIHEAISFYLPRIHEQIFILQGGNPVKIIRGHPFYILSKSASS